MRSYVCALALGVVLSAAGQTSNEFFAMDTAMVKKLGTPLERPDIEMLAQYGYRGVGPVAWDPAMWRHLTETLIPLLDEKKLKLYAVYSNVRVDRGGYLIDPGIKQNLAALKGRGTIIWLPIASKDFKPSDPAGDTQTVAAVSEIADAAARYGLSVSLYPHFGNLMERVSDAMRMERVLKLAMPRLTLVTINGADRNGKDWGQLIQPLDRGDFDIPALLAELRHLGYHGPIGLQGYDVANKFQIEQSENLRRSMAAWRDYAKPSR